MTDRAAAPRFWTVVLLLLGTARRRAAGRTRRGLAQQRKRGGFAVAPDVALRLVIVVALVVNIGAAVGVAFAVRSAEQVQAEANGRIIVDDWFAVQIARSEADAAATPLRRAEISRAEDRYIATEAAQLAREKHGDQAAISAQLTATVRNDPQALLSSRLLAAQPGRLPDLMALILAASWCLMMICQGDGPDLDTQRSRDPMWEWVFSHPVPPAAVFVAEMLAPIAANPIFLTAPLFPGVLYGLAYGWGGGIAGALLVGVPAAIALACVSKAIEIWALLRLSPRKRGAVLGLIGTIGFAPLAVWLFLALQTATIFTTISRWLLAASHVPWPRTRLLVGQTGSGDFVFWKGLLLCWLLAALLIFAAIALARISTRGGLSYRPRTAAERGSVEMRFGRDPLYRKELLWFRRDGSALVQAVLLPLSLAAVQAFNMRGVLSSAMGAWNTICGAAILFGTYFLLVLGPRSLVSEGQALWIAQTWPRGLESLLKAKAKLWAEIATAIVGVILLYAAFRFPSDIAQTTALGLAWYVFARSLADKTVTLATMTASSGEREKPRAGLRWAATLGSMSFAVGVFGRQWPLAISGVVYSQLTAAAMWQHFRFRLPFLADPWSETLPPAPTLLHAMVTISAMIEAIAVLAGLAAGTGGGEVSAGIVALIYGLCATAAAVGVSTFLAGRGVTQRDIWLWDATERKSRPLLQLNLSGKLRVLLLVATAAAVGAGLGLLAHLYLHLLHWWPDLGQALDAARSRLAASPGDRWAVWMMAVAFAPLAEEFLFRGLLYRALDREWGGWRAVVGAGAFFAIYHPVVSWAPVAALGMINAMLFKRYGRLAPTVVLHMVYNAVVLAF
ncbi:CPBP family intramembrane glutamic endopeptidase [Bradyrhizobium sp. HKCCYLS20291]|uniref:CPBP family intramembrane glutamic endopeptidase n=1 Tax=Bradyrhizobium sp. HKCCYLS20291 TaxID=3420766 RepID=UPI003EB9D149